ncbi:hypothetical protein C2G38_2175186 [Gigaspora rosea]|uniref:F-box domain-containing protein n=1 Tax=Gigaspora rosea TaxID=44941 RepID=A0A397VJC5_9GLOM|nr:hypothetical protein C2G38_2175186 [Gigaspora rosea]
MNTLPTDCLYQIFQYFKDDLKTLHSCLLSNRTCCQLIIPILWSNPWKLIQKKESTPEYRNSLRSLISTLLSCLPSESKQFLHDKRIHWTSHTIFLNYITYCRTLDFHSIWDMLDVVSAQHPLFPFSNLKIHIKNIVGQEICKMIILQSTKITQMIISETSYSFFNLFQNLSLNDSQSLSHLNEFEYEINENSNILNFYNIPNVCKNISNFTIHLKTTPSESFIDLIKSQNSIKFMDITFDYYPSLKYVKSLLLHANTLTHLFVSCHHEKTFYNIFSAYHTFSNLRVLSYHFYNDYDNVYYEVDDDYNGIVKIVNVNLSLPNLEILELGGQTTYSYHRTIAQIIQGTQGKLERIYMNYRIYDTNLIINQSILRSCQNLKFLTTHVTKDTLDIFNITDISWNFSTKNLELFLKRLEKEELVEKLNISLIYKQIDLYLDKILELFGTYYLKGVIASYFIEDENDVLDEFNNWQDPLFEY